MRKRITEGVKFFKPHQTQQNFRSFCCFSSTLNQITKAHQSKAYYHPFNQALYQGYLSKETFHSFLFNDKWYLKHFSRYFYDTAGRQSNPYHRKHLYRLASMAFETEENMYKDYLACPESCASLNQTQVLPAVKRYVAHLKYHAYHAPPIVALATFLPCFYLYAAIGIEMKQQGIAVNHPYRLWIESYASLEFLASKQRLVEIIQELSSKTSYDEQQQSTWSFKQSIQHEFNFWETVMHQDNSQAPALILKI